MTQFLNADESRSELRWNPLTRNYTIIAPSRGKRPGSFIINEEIDAHLPHSEVCAFCTGNEEYTPPAILTLNKNNSDDWFVRVVPNKYPVLRIEGDLHRNSAGLYDVVSGIGAHEVVIESPNCSRQLADLEISEIELTLKAWKIRLADLKRDDRFRSIMIFKNHGSLAGATMKHSHSQIVALPERPYHLQTILNSAREHYSRKERCIFCDIVEFESNAQERIVFEDNYFTLLCPFASSFPFEMNLIPKKHLHDFSEIPDNELYACAHALRDAFIRLNKTLNYPAYNLVLMTSPPPRKKLNRPDYWGSIREDFHWHFMITPRIARSAGFEWGSGVQINPVTPEEAASFLRAIVIQPE